MYFRLTSVIKEEKKKKIDFEVSHFEDNLLVLVAFMKFIHIYEGVIWFINKLVIILIILILLILLLLLLLIIIIIIIIIIIVTIIILIIIICKYRVNSCV